MDAKKWLYAVAPIVILAAILAGLFIANPFADMQRGEALPDLTVNQKALNEDEFVLSVTNNGPETQKIKQVLVDDAYWSFNMEGETIKSGETKEVTIPYHWTEGWDFEVALITSAGAVFHQDIVAAHETPGASADLIWKFVLIGLFVGVIPVALGMLWFPFLGEIKSGHLHAVLAFSVGVLMFLAFDAGFEAFEIAHGIPGFLEGNLLVVTAIVGAFLAIQAVSSTKKGEGSRLWLAYIVAIGIGLHNLAEGLAIGSSFAVGRFSLAVSLVAGFMIHNVTEGPAVVAPIAEGERPAWLQFVALGAIAGAPVIIGGWIGSLAYTPTLAAFFLAIGVGAILQVSWEITDMIRRESQKLGAPLTIVGFFVGFIAMYATDILVSM
ncbi:MAG: ZIP family metal transporter [Halobacteria archaeon]